VPGLVPHFEHFNGMTPVEQSGLQPMVTNGGHWMFSVPQTLHLVHAVQRPLARPVMGPLAGDRATAGAPGGVVTGTVTVHGASTGSLVLHGTWTETIDDPDAADAPEGFERRARAKQDTAGATDVDVDVRFALGSTKRIDLTVTGEAISRFVDYFTEEVAVTFTAAPVLLDAAGVVTSTVSITTTGGTRATEGTDYTLDAEAGTVRRVAGGLLVGEPNAAVRFVARPVSRPSTEEAAGSESQLVVPASQPPAPPVVHEILPASTATTQSSPTLRRHTRNGQLLRIWLDRPWLSSGDFERLGVVVDQCRLGRDPGADGGTPAPAVLSTGSFDREAFVVTDVDGSGHDVAVYDVTYNEARQRWYADVEVVLTSGYRPWITLALARHQADAIAGAHLSPVVVETSLRLGLRRDVSVRPTGSGTVRVTVTGDDHDGVDAPLGGKVFNEITVTVQEADTGVADPDLRWNDLSSTVLARQQVGLWRSVVASPAGSGGPLRVLVVEREPIPRHEGPEDVVRPVAVFVETIEFPNAWLAP
jgi:hypothetical protein